MVEFCAAMVESVSEKVVCFCSVLRCCSHGRSGRCKTVENVDDFGSVEMRLGVFWEVKRMTVVIVGFVVLVDILEEILL
jgi:hypothetical protein